MLVIWLFNITDEQVKGKVFGEHKIKSAYEIVTQARGCRFGKHPSRLPYLDFEGSSEDPSRIPKTNIPVFEGSSKDPSRIPKTNIPVFEGSF